MDCIRYPIPPKLVAIATEFDWKPTRRFPDPTLPGPTPLYGQDLEFGLGRRAPNGEDVGSTEAELKPKMERLLNFFAHDDDTGMAERLFKKFLAKQSKVTYFEHPTLNKTISAHDAMDSFCRAALGAPFPWEAPAKPGVTSIHQALKAAKWDIAKLAFPTNLSTPDFNQGDKWTILGDSTGDWANGLAVMIHAVQYVYVIATHYHYDKGSNAYCIRLEYVGLDVFGLDDKDVDKYGAKEDNWHTHNAKIGITAWWQLQHQHAYAPLITRFVVERTFEVLAL